MKVSCCHCLDDVDVPKLCVLQIGELIPSLSEMDGSYNFYYAPEFELRCSFLISYLHLACDSLKSLSFGNRAFVNTLVFRIHGDFWNSILL